MEGQNRRYSMGIESNCQKPMATMNFGMDTVSRIKEHGTVFELKGQHSIGTVQ